jgi:hypothetical protein
MGGALAMLAALGVYAQSPVSIDRLRVVTFGEPRLGNQAFAQYVTRTNMNITRVVHDNDVIPQLPPRWLDYVHHGGSEVWISASDRSAARNQTAKNTAKMNATTDDTNGVDSALVCRRLYEDERCSNSRNMYSWFSHLTYWDIAFGPWC